MPRFYQQLVRLLVTMSLCVALVGCKSAPDTPQYARPLPPGADALRKVINLAEMPSLRPAFIKRDKGLLEALTRSLAWFDRPSTQQHYPVRVDGDYVSHRHAHLSVFAFRQVVATMDDAHAFDAAIKREFDIYTSVGWDNRGTVFYTGYYSPVFRASFTRDGTYRYPLYTRPPQLQTDPASGAVLGWTAADGKLVKPPTRAQIETQNMLTGLELVYLPSRLDAYMIEVNGSARLEMTDGSVLHIGYAGNNGYDYVSIGKRLAADGKVDPNRVNMTAIRDHFRSHPEELDGYIQQNPRFVFFKEYDGANWPAGSLGFPVTPWRSLATDKAIFPRGGVVLVDTTLSTTPGSPLQFEQFMLDQDTGGAIRAAGRADIYMGVGDVAGHAAGRQATEGRLYYLLLKRERLEYWSRIMAGGSARAPAADAAATTFD